MNHLLELLMLKETNLEHSMYSTNNLTRTSSGKARPTKTCLYKDLGISFPFYAVLCSNMWHLADVGSQVLK